MDDLARQIADKVIADTQYFSALIGFIGVFVGAVLTIIGNIILHYLDRKKERRQEILKRELDRLYKLEELAGEITEWSSSYQLNLSSEELHKKINDLKIAAGTFRRYPELKQAIRDLNQHAMIVIDDKLNRKNFAESETELEEKYKNFVSVFEDVINKIKA